MVEQKKIAQSDIDGPNSTSQSKFMVLNTEADPLAKREQFAVSLRKEKKKQILAAKRQRLCANLHNTENLQLISQGDQMQQKQVLWSSQEQREMAILLEYAPRYSEQELT